MSDLLEFARGPLFVITFTYMVLALGRQIFLRTWGLVKVLRRTPKRDVPWGKIARNTASWVFPVKHVTRDSFVMTITSLVMHVGLILVPVFLASHVFLWQRGAGLSWPTLGGGVADFLTILTISTVAILFVFRWVSRVARQLSTRGDYLILIAIVLPFVSGFLAAHPASSPLAYKTMMLIHVLSAELVFVLLPTTKLAHVVLFVFDRISPEIFWRLVPGAGEKVAETLRGSTKGAEV